MTDMAGKTCIVTGASAGIGSATAVGLARRGASLALVGRDSARLEKVAAECAAAGSPAVGTYGADFASLDQVRSLAVSLLDDLPRIDVLINNAALVLQHRELSEDGYEKVFAVNHLAPYLLTRLLLDRLVTSAPSRIVNVASDAHTFGPMEPDDYMSTRAFKPMKVYGRSKLANILFTVELAERLKDTEVVVNCLHPGFVSTSLARDNKIGALFLKLARPFIKSPADGAQTTLQLACGPVSTRGKYYSDGKVHATKDYAKDPAMAARLWDDSARLVGLE
ncbi:MAG: short-chain dehydrogenase [Frankiales bacterium]|nr:short-chain dehydrogenase [Frankiales bacterium]